LKVVLYRSACIVAAVECRRLQAAERNAKGEERIHKNFRGKVSSTMLPLKSMGWKLDILKVTASGFKDELCW